MSTIADFTETELWLVHNTLEERDERDVDVRNGDSEIRLSSAARELTDVLVLFWSERDANFVVFETSERRNQSQLFSRSHQQYRTGVDEFDDLSECLVTTLPIQADREAGMGPTKSSRRWGAGDTNVAAIARQRQNEITS